MLLHLREHEPAWKGSSLERELLLNVKRFLDQIRCNDAIVDESDQVHPHICCYLYD